ncbi:OXSM family protein [Megaselia abdita]
MNSKSRRVVVTGIGAVTPLGNSIKESWKNLKAGKSAIKKLTSDDYKTVPARIAAQVDKSSLELEKHFSKTDMKLMSPATQLALLAAREAVESAGFKDLNEDQKLRTGACVGMGMFDMEEIYKSHTNFMKGYNKVSPYFIPRILPNMACGHISMEFGLKGPNHSVSTACATGAHAIGDAYRFIKYGDADAMLAGSGESCIDPLSIAGFCRLRALSTSFNDNPEVGSRPFDEKREGFVMGEGAAIFVLEELESAKRRNAPILAEILGYGLSGDAHHITSPSGLGAQMAMSRAIETANLGSCKDQIEYVNAHATSTPTGDKIEAEAINKTFGAHSKNVFVSSTKGAHGHLLGSSGNLEAAFVALACKEGIIPPSINIEKVGEGIDLNIAQSATKWGSERRIALKNSFGFGGTNACLCISNFVD